MRTLTKLNLSEIVYLQADSNYTVVHLINGHKVVSGYCLKKHETELDGFLRVNSSHLINPKHVEGFEQNGLNWSFILTNKLRVKVSRRKSKQLKHFRTLWS